MFDADALCPIRECIDDHEDPEGAIESYLERASTAADMLLAMDALCTMLVELDADDALDSVRERAVGACLRVRSPDTGQALAILSVHRALREAATGDEIVEACEGALARQEDETLRAALIGFLATDPARHAERIRRHASRVGALTADVAQAWNAAELLAATDEAAREAWGASRQRCEAILERDQRLGTDPYLRVRTLALLARAHRAQDRGVDAERCSTEALELARTNDRGALPEEAHVFLYGGPSRTNLGLAEMQHAARMLSARSFGAFDGALEDERVFGPRVDFRCACGCISGPEHYGAICDSCRVEVITSSVRAVRFAHIDFPTPIVHPRYVEAIAMLLDDEPTALRERPGDEIEGRLGELDLHALREELLAAQDAGRKYMGSWRVDERLAIVDAFLAYDGSPSDVLIQTAAVLSPDLPLPRAELDRLNEASRKLLETARGGDARALGPATAAMFDALPPDPRHHD